MTDQRILEQLKIISNLHGVYFLKLRVERRYAIPRRLVKDQEYLEMEQLLERHFYCEWNGNIWSMDLKIMLLEVYPMVENNFHFSYEMIVALRSVVGDSSHVILPEVPGPNDEQYSYGSWYMPYEDRSGKPYHKAEWEKLDFDGVVNWYTKDREYLWGSLYNLRPGSWFGLLHLLDTPLNRVNQKIYNKISMYPVASMVYLYCNEKEWNKYRVIALWRLYIYYKEPLDVSILWDDYRAVIDTILQYRNPDLNSYPDLYEKSVIYVSEAKDLVLSDGRYLNLYKSL